MIFRDFSCSVLFSVCVISQLGVVVSFVTTPTPTSNRLSSSPFPQPTFVRSSVSEPSTENAAKESEKEVSVNAAVAAKQKEEEEAREKAKEAEAERIKAEKAAAKAAEEAQAKAEAEEAEKKAAKAAAAAKAAQAEEERLKAEAKKKAEEAAKLAEEAKKLEEARIAEEARKAEAAKQAALLAKKKAIESKQRALLSNRLERESVIIAARIEAKQKAEEARAKREWYRKPNKSKEEEEELAKRYASIECLEARAYQILADLSHFHPEDDESSWF